MIDKKFREITKKEIKKEEILNNICKECGRKDIFPIYCNKCWNIMEKEIK